MSKSFSVELKRYADIRWTLFKKILSTCILWKDQQGALTMVETKKFRKNVLSAMTSLTTQPHGFMVVHTGFKAYWIQFFKLWFKLEKKRMRFHGSPSLWLTSYNHTRVTQPKHISKSIQIEDSHHDLSWSGHILHTAMSKDSNRPAIVLYCSIKPSEFWTEA